MASGDEEQIKLARKQIQNLEQTVKTDEEFREERNKADKSQSTLLRISDGIKGFNDKLSDMAKGGGFIAGLAGIVLAVFSPETLALLDRRASKVDAPVTHTLERAPRALARPGVAVERDPPISHHLDLRCTQPLSRSS